MTNAFAVVNKLGGATRAPIGVSSAIDSPRVENRSKAAISAPDDLMHFVRENSVGDVTRELGVARGTVHRLRHGYWPADPDKLLITWGRYKASKSMVESSWFMRRVRVDGTVRHAGHDYTAPRLAARAGQLLAVARAADGGLLAQTLELPAERMPLVQVVQEAM